VLLQLDHLQELTISPQLVKANPPILGELKAKFPGLVIKSMFN
jgi:hypothetical protein